MLVPRGQELDWVFCAPNGLWDLLFSASVSRLVVLRRLTQQQQEEEEQHQYLPPRDKQGHPSEIRADAQGNECVDDVDVTNKEREQEGKQHQHKRAQRDLFTDPHFLRLAENDATLNRYEHEIEVERHGHAHAYCASEDRESHPLRIDSATFDNDCDDTSFQRSLTPLLHYLFPWSICHRGPAPDAYVTYEDHVGTRLIREKRHSEALGGGILVEDVELDGILGDGASLVDMDSNKCKPILRRRMRFQQMPNLIQTEVPIFIYKNGQLSSMHGLKDVKAELEKFAYNNGSVNESVSNSGEVGIVSQVKFEVRLDHSKLVQKYLPSIVAGLVLAAPCFDACKAANMKARFLAIGLGGGVLPVFLNKHFGFSVLAVDTDEIVVDLARRHFGLVENESFQVQVRDGMDMVFSIAHHACTNDFVSVEMSKDWQAALKDPTCRELCQHGILGSFECVDARMHVIVVDVNVADAHLGLLSPPACFLSKAFLLAVRLALHEGGMLVINVIPRAEHNFKVVVDSLRKVFSGIYQIRIEDNHVLFVFPSGIADIDMSGDFALRVTRAVGDDLFDKIEEIG